MTDEPHQDVQNMHLDPFAHSKLPFLDGLIRNIRKRYWKGITELKNLTFQLQPQLRSYNEISQRYLMNSISELKEQRVASMENVVKAIKLEIYMTFIK